jgi:hypothetical protein
VIVCCVEHGFWVHRRCDKVVMHGYFLLSKDDIARIPTKT